MKISESIKYIGVNDHEIDLFEGQYPVPNGMAYNSYVILDEEIAVLDVGNLSPAIDGCRQLKIHGVVLDTFKNLLQHRQLTLGTERKTLLFRWVLRR